MPQQAKSSDYLNKIVSVVMDRPLGTKHPKHGFVYEVNYGYSPNIVSGDGEELDAYVLGIDKPLKEFTGRCIAIIRRTNNNDVLSFRQSHTKHPHQPGQQIAATRAVAILYCVFLGGGF